MEKVLYKKNSKGKILTWEVSSLQSYSKMELVIKSGEYFGAKTLHFKKVESKNIGKSNETSLEEQANLMIKSLILEKRKYGYKTLADLNIDAFQIAVTTTEALHDILQELLPKDATDLDGMLKPMLAAQYFRSKKDWKDDEGNLHKDRKYYYLKNPYVAKEKGFTSAKFPMIAQPKINGLRAFIYLEDDEVKIKSKNGEPFVVEHIIDWFSARKHLFFTEKEEPIVYDGELYIHHTKLQYIASAINKPNFDTPQLVYKVYDLAIPNYKQKDRLLMIKELLKETEIEGYSSPVQYVKSVVLYKDLDVQIKCDSYIKEGYEGLMLRNMTALYPFGKRTVNLLKLKRLIDAEFQVIGIKPQDNDSELGLYICMTEQGEEFEVTPTENEDYKRLMILSPHLFIGKLLTCSFYEYTDSGKPFHISHTIIRDYENNETNRISYDI